MAPMPLRHRRPKRLRVVRPIALVVVLLLASACTYIPPSLEPVSDPPTRADPSPSAAASSTPSPATVTPSPIIVTLPPRAERPGDPLLITCDSAPFPVSVFDEPPGDELEDHPSAAVLRQALTLPRDPGVGDLGWRRVYRDETSASYLTGTGPVYNYFLIEVGPTGWEWNGRYGECTFYPDLEGHTPVTWTLDPAFPGPKATSKLLHLLVLEQACASGKPVIDRLLAPAIVYEPDGVFITFAALPLPGDGQDCQGNAPDQVTVRLREPLGDRTLRGWEPPSGTGG
jgi:hypothetical protein